MKRLIPLVELGEGQEGIITDVHGGHGLRRNLEGLGVAPGRKVKMISKHFRAGPVVISVVGTQVAMGYGMARKILVQPLPKNSAAG